MKILIISYSKILYALCVLVTFLVLSSLERKDGNNMSKWSNIDWFIIIIASLACIGVIPFVLIIKTTSYLYEKNKKLSIIKNVYFFFTKERSFYNKKE